MVFTILSADYHAEIFRNSLINGLGKQLQVVIFVTNDTYNVINTVKNSSLYGNGTRQQLSFLYLYLVFRIIADPPLTTQARALSAITSKSCEPRLMSCKLSFCT
ncbi:hypothetical protein ACOSQ3_018036 [Xanthoceras sorbifolium]